MRPFLQKLHDLQVKGNNFIALVRFEHEMASKR